jgi:hypothetical protein
MVSAIDGAEGELFSDFAEGKGDDAFTGIVPIPQYPRVNWLEACRASKRCRFSTLLHATLMSIRMELGNRRDDHHAQRERRENPQRPTELFACKRRDGDARQAEQVHRLQRRFGAGASIGAHEKRGGESNLVDGSPSTLQRRGGVHDVAEIPFSVLCGCQMR